MKKITTDFTQYEIILTDDDSLTLYSQFFDENCHSLAGAKSETLHNYILGCELPRFIFPEPKNFSILEVGFGLGTGLLTTIDYLTSKGFSKKLNFVSLEIDYGLIEFTISQNKCKYPFLKKLQLIKLENQSYYFYEDKQLKVIILIGDALEVLPLALGSFLQEKFQVIYQDAFSPKKNPELWTENWFQILKECSDKNVILSTYSAAGGIKRSLIKAGFSISSKKGYHLKKSITIAKIKEDI